MAVCGKAVKHCRSLRPLESELAAPGCALNVQMTLSRLLKFSVPQFPHLHEEENDEFTSFTKRPVVRTT